MAGMAVLDGAGGHDTAGCGTWICWQRLSGAGIHYV